MSRVDKAALVAFLIAVCVGYAATRAPIVRAAIEYARLPNPAEPDPAGTTPEAVTRTIRNLQEARR